MARLTRQELKKDGIRDSLEQFEHFAKERHKEMLAVTGMVLVVVGLAAGLKLYVDRQEAEANTLLGAALKTFGAYVGTPAANTQGVDTESFPTARQKYQKALEQLRVVTEKFPRTKAAAIARYHLGVCQADLGDHASAIKTLQEASLYSDRNIASLAKLALAGELAQTGKIQEAVKLDQDLADHPTSAVPRATALLQMADAYRASQPAQARQIYERIEKEFGSDTIVAEAVKLQLASLPH